MKIYWITGGVDLYDSADELIVDINEDTARLRYIDICKEKYNASIVNIDYSEELNPALVKVSDLSVEGLLKLLGKGCE